MHSLGISPPITTGDRWLDLAIILAGIAAVLVNQWAANRRQAVELKSHLDTKRDEMQKEIVSKVEETKQQAKEAFNDANNFNQKILNLATKIESMDQHGTAMSVAGFRSVNERLNQQETLLAEIKQLILYPPSDKKGSNV